MKKLLITGSSGFIGSYFINKYKKDYHIKTFSFRNNDINSLDCSEIDVVVHLSALVHQMGGATIDEYEKINVIQTLKLANKAKQSGIKHFIFMSTVKVYGEETSNCYKQDTLCNPVDEYGVSKLKVENELLKLQDENFKVSIIRTPIVYGYGVKANIKSLVSLVNKVPILPLGKIKNSRTMIYIGNLCFFIDEIIKQKKEGTFLVGDDESLSTTKLCEEIAKSLNKNVWLIKVPFFESLLKLLKPSFHKRLYKSLEVDNSETKKRLKVELPYNTADGIRYMIKGEK
ncbi:epimerase [Malaciobacter molluscorum LMG 25693]|uniref:Epimerase n=1 Tax=Malaciobacter molluscorum LMG 25693 TaxID=870501 RepID=A0A2G1DFE7_9BACT|nr:NAD-dependent epimerase/dehydratase family protein [Malaciobacter molluscorum]AXX91798.1 UDP-glucose 4-epimerase [Malaciobacter molluscorum LMG 25693]PHO17209.1 epimerase [Malaciobacter molluscorum LMG 25693]